MRENGRPGPPRNSAPAAPWLYRDQRRGHFSTPEVVEWKDAEMFPVSGVHEE